MIKRLVFFKMTVLQQNQYVLQGFPWLVKFNNFPEEKVTGMVVFSYKFNTYLVKFLTMKESYRNISRRFVFQLEKQKLKASFGKLAFPRQVSYNHKRTVCFEVPRRFHEQTLLTRIEYSQNVMKLLLKNPPKTKCLPNADVSETFWCYSGVVS